MIIGLRLRQCRELLGLTQAQLAVTIGVNQSTIAYIENERLSPTDQMLWDIARETGFPPAFFRQGAPIEFPLGSLLFRSRASASRKQQSTVHRYAQVVYEGLVKLANHFKSVPLKLPQIDEGPAVGANIARTSMGLSPDTPIDHLVNRLEKSGVTVLAVPKQVEKIDAFSLWLSYEGLERPVVVVLDGKPVDRMRFSVAHEIGHIVMHRDNMRGSLVQLEKEADQFASELLLPEMPIREELVPPITLMTLTSMKSKWKVSIQALIMRSSDLGIITDRQKRYLFQQLSSKGWRTEEPGSKDLPEERPRAFKQMAETLYGRPIDTVRLAEDTLLPHSVICETLEVFAESTHNPAKPLTARTPSCS